MQIDSNYKHLEEATVGWEFLKYLSNQRYDDDWKEILKGALYIRNKAEATKKLYGSDLSDEDAILMTVKDGYSAERFGRARADQYRKIKSLFDYSK